jgi:adenylate cyclase
MTIGSALNATFASRATTMGVAGCAVLGIYLFAMRPAALPDEATSERKVPINLVFRMLAAENDAARGLYTAEVVGPGQKVGLIFDEKWRDPKFDAGPLPALFLREAASFVRQTYFPLGLFLGSDFPISQSNLFKGPQEEHYQTVKQTGNPEFFYAADVKLQTAMFPDYAIAPGCVTCHNEHPESPKTDWKLRDMMGATTWSYPKDAVTPEEMVQIIAVLRAGFAKAYEAYLTKAASFNKQPEVGERWPRDGYFVPSAEVFMREFERRASPETMTRLLQAVGSQQGAAHKAGSIGR